MVHFALGFFCAAAIAAAMGLWVRRRFLRLIVRTGDAERRAAEAARLAELGTLTAGLAHEIKNPLSTILLNLQLLEEDVADQKQHLPPRVPSRLVTVRSEAQRLREILEGFLRYAGRFELDRQPADLQTMLDQLTDFLSPQASQQRVHLRLSPGGPVMAQVDIKQLKQAVLNLALNAMQVMPEGGDLMLAARQTPDGALIEVTDTGPGIAEEVRGKIFDAYFSRRKGGTGLGLAITRRIANAHGGTITLDSELGQGTRFTISLPARDDDR